ncbi:MAG TPA: tripartite tricarboxylate transporter substrate-binding protein [Alphaproteobacteria bacterium]|jgi:tripartite-type tricarboxylate transporter receptor subunit TctC
MEMGKRPFGPRSLLAAGLAGVLAGGIMAAAAGGAEAQSVEQFYKGRQIRFILGSAGGGGYDVYSRTITRYMGRYIPGNPTFLIQSMPGAGGLVSANYIYGISPKDGSEIGMTGRASAIEPLINPSDKSVKFEATKFNWLGTPQQELGLLLVSTKTPIKTLADLKTNELTVSSTGRAAATSVYPRLMNNLFGTKFKVVEGYKSSQEALLALERGEVAGHSSGGSSAAFRARIAPWLKDGSIKVMMQLSVTKDPDYPDVPLITELATNDSEKQILELVLVQQVMGRPMLAPPNVPADRVKALRDAFDATMKDKDFLAEAEKQQLEVKPVSGAELNAMLERVYATPKAVTDKVAELLSQE